MLKNKLFSPHTLLLVLVGLLVNFLGVKLALYFGWPVFLDPIGTILAAALGGYLPGLLVGFFSNAINSFADPITLYYGLVSILFAFLAATLSRRGVFKSLGKTMLCVPLFTLLGGGLGSLLTWLLYGFEFGSGISAPLAQFFYAKLTIGKFWSQFSADMLIDLLDKLVSLLLVFGVLRLLPARVLQTLPYGCLYLRGEAALAEADALRNPFSKRTSLSSKVVILIVSTAAIVGSIAMAISFIIYRNTAMLRSTERCEAAAALVAEAVEPKSVQRYLHSGVTDEAYEDTRESLYAIRDAFIDIRFIYIYQIRPDGCHVVFDLDTEDVPAGSLGDIVPLENDFAPFMDKLLAGEDIPAVHSNGYYGWLLTVYKPLRDASGECVAYIGVDMDMRDIIVDLYMFVIRVASLLFGATVLISAFAIWFAQTKIVAPINTIATAAGHFAYDSESQRAENMERLHALHIDTGDEIENLFDAISRTYEEMDRYVRLIADKTADIEQKANTIARMQNNVIWSFASMVEARDENTGGHINRTATYVLSISEALVERGVCPELATPEQAANYMRSAPLHDIGKIRIPDAILNKPGRLTPEEFDIIKTHTVIGGELLQKALGGIEDSGYLADAIDMASCHHERWDGKGYPKGLSHTDIPLSARIMAVADVFDALISKRSYKSPMPFEEAVQLIRSEAGSHFDPAVVEAFLARSEDIRALSQADA